MPVLKGAGGSVVGLDIGSSYIKAVEARLGKDRAVVTAFGVMPTPTDAVDERNNVILDPVGLGAAVRKLLDQAGIKSRKVVSTVASQSSLVVRIIPVPKMNRTELEETMKWEVERHVPFQPSEIVRDFQPLTSPEDVPEGGQMEVLLAVAQDGFINQHLAALKAAGLEPVAIDIQPLALSRSLIDLANGGGAGDIGVMNLGANVSDINIYKDGVLAFTRPIPLAGNTFTRAISDLIGAPLDVAERLKREYAHVPEGAVIQHEPDFGGGFDFGTPLGDQTIDFGVPPTANEPAGPGAPQPPPADAMDFAAGGFGGGSAGGFRNTTEGPVFETPDEEPAARPRQVFDLGGSEPEPPAPVVSPVNPFADTEFANPFALTGETHPVPAGADDETARQIADAITPVLGELVTELRRSLDYYRSRPQGGEVQRLIVCGGTASLPGLDRFLSAQVGIPVERANPLAHVQMAARVDSDYAAEIAPVLPVSLGLAVREMLVEAPSRKGGRRR
jgi:type IV pilus assembly protein PilM